MKREYILVKGRDLYKEILINENTFLSNGDITWAELKRYDDSELKYNSYCMINGNHVFKVDSHVTYYKTENKNSIKIGTHSYFDIILDNDYFENEIEVKIEENELYINSKEDIFLNGYKTQREFEEVKPGDVILIRDLKVVLYETYIQIIGNGEIYKSKLEPKIVNDYMFENFPKYKRSPRMIKKSKPEEIEIVMPPSENKIKKGSLVKIIVPPLVMMSMTIIMNIIKPRGIYAIVGIIGTLMSTIFSVSAYLNERKENKFKNKKREEVYNKYLLNQRKRINELRTNEVESISYSNPSIKEIENMINTYSSRIYERNINDFDFLNIDIGKMDILPSYNVKLNDKEISLEEDSLVEEAKSIKNQFSTLKEMPTQIDLKNSHLGIVGETKDIHEQLKLIFAQLTFSQSYQDLEIIFLHDEKYRDEFSYLKWYPHFKLKSTNVTGIIDTERVRDQVLGSINKILKDRKTKVQDKNKEERFTPHFIFVIDDPRLIINNSIMEYLQNEENKNLGFSIIYTTNLKSNLPEYIKTVVTLDDKNIGTFLIKNGLMVNKKINLNHIENVDLENISRKLACIEHVHGISNNIPESITFFEMYDIKHPEELNISERWDKNESHKSLAVPLGVRGENDFVELNLHEKAHGPHGLVAGTTGSGKSEIVQSYILSLAVNFHPYEVGFLLIDYKGGGMASLFKNLPHLLGTITNLDGAESMRAMASIKSELERRQFLFNEYGVNHINSYNKLFKTGKAKEPLPHLFLISDEFAELKKEQPDFMSELVSAARIGRSLGIHLILATQKPSGVVDDQIWSNSKFKLALKVQNEGDSNEVIKTPDAAGITLPGRAFLQVGNNEIYELFQSAWSGASYEKDEESKTIDDRVYLINELGQSHLLNKDLSASEVDNKLKESELDVVVNHINDIFTQMKMEEVKRPWLPSLEDSIQSPYIDLDKVKDVGEFDTLDMNVALGLVDLPERQSQEEYNINFEEDGNLAIFSSPGFGKSTTLTTIALSLAMKNSPGLLNYYVLDLGNTSLIQLKELPHTADYLTFDDTEKLDKLIKILEIEIKRRKKLLGEKNAMNFNMYNKISDEKLEAKIIFIDNYDVIKEFGYEVEDFINKLSRDGVGLGIYLIITASRSGSIKYATLNNFKNKFTLYMFDNTEVNSIVGRSPYGIKEVKGRALVKQENVNSMQVYKSSSKKDDMEHTLEVGNIIVKIKTLNTKGKAKGIPTIPESLNRETIKAYINKQVEDNFVSIGLDTEEIEVMYLDLDQSSNIIVGSNQSGKTSLVKIVIDKILENENKTYIFDSSDMDLYMYKDNELVTYIESIEEASDFIKFIKEECLNIKMGYDEAKLLDSTLKPRDYYQKLKKKYIVIEDVDKFIDIIKGTKNFEAEKIIQEGLQYGFKVVATTNSNKMKGFDNITKTLKDNAQGVILCAHNEQTVFGVVPGIKAKKPELGFGYMYKKGEMVPIMVSKY